ncbi:MAG TPA: hypothetical protein VNS88_11780, partial [Nitrospiraceae bacterium]|nr:hypothetical protein [Nitrospiraceae bacterium]
MSDEDTVESLQAEREILLAKIVRLEDKLKGKGTTPYDPEEPNAWVDSIAAKKKKEEEEKPFVLMWAVIAAFIMIVIIAGLVNRFVEW